MKVKEIMTKEVKFIDPNLSIKEAARLMKERDLGALPVGENDKLVGVITDRDITIRALANGHDIESVTIKEIMTPHCLYCFEEDSIEDAAKNMGKNQIRRLPVINKDKRLVGIISLGDIVSKGSKPA
ncbi:MAG TPA: CBS domain-containing protein, partial [Alphaproteobacteria bacterium]|nr:CBS domain-containing protein [Alphaproteobacteria bacterium]